jgi:hypothetical protein
MAPRSSLRQNEKPGLPHPVCSFSMNITQTQTRLGSAFHSMDVILISTQIYNEGEENVGVLTAT